MKSNVLRRLTFCLILITFFLSLSIAYEHKPRVNRDQIQEIDYSTFYVAIIRLESNHGKL